jgi:hypothetical protein
MNAPLQVKDLELTVEETLSGTVLCTEEASYRVRTARGVLAAMLAPSCLLLPQEGDEVLVFDGARGAVITAVTARGETSAVIQVPGRDGELRARGRLKIAAGVVELAAVRTRIASDTVALFANKVEVGVASARVIARKVDVALDSMVTRAKRCFRWIEELDQLRAGRIDQRAKGGTRLEAESMIISAEQVVQVRGEQIHLS